jgi:rubrerythrin
VYCPYCANELQMHNGELSCIAGDMGLSKNLEQAMREYYASSPPAQPEPPLGYKTGARWFCPGCATPIQGINSDFRCPGCGKSLNRFHYQLVELHPHKR